MPKHGLAACRWRSGCRRRSRQPSSSIDHSGHGTFCSYLFPAGLVRPRRAILTKRFEDFGMSETAIAPNSARETSTVWVIVAIVCIGSFMGQLDASITQLVL